jgi:hypothetical protein
LSFPLLFIALPIDGAEKGGTEWMEREENEDDDE